jgi:uncharacterized delta-60 repeat protein
MRRTGLAAVLVACALPAPAAANHGAPDTTFGTNGTVVGALGHIEGLVNVPVTTSSSRTIFPVLTQKIGGCTSTWDVFRRNENGSLDTAFGGDGFGTDIGFLQSPNCMAAALDQSGRLVAAGAYTDGTTRAILVARYLSSGSLDTTFSGDGRFQGLITAGQHSRMFGLAIQADGKIVIAGDTVGGTSSSQFAVARLTSAGAFDTTFSGDGRVVTDLDLSANVLNAATARDVLVQPDGKIVVAGTYGPPSTSTADRVGLARYNPDGTLDATFAGDGTLIGDPEDDLDVGALSRDPSGRYVVGGVKNAAAGTSGFAHRYTSAGRDTTFAAAGMTAFNAGPGGDGVFDVVHDADGRVIVAGYIGNSTTTANSLFAVGRLLGDGSADTTLDTDGRVSTDFTDTSGGGTGHDRVNNFIIQPQGRLLAGGTTGPGNSAFAAYHGRRDSRRPRVRVRSRDTSLRRVSRRRILRVTLSAREAVGTNFALTLVGGAQRSARARLARGATVLSAAGRRTVRLRLGRRAARRLRRLRSARLRLTGRGVDGGGNRFRAVARVTLH